MSWSAAAAYALVFGGGVGAVVVGSGPASGPGHALAVVANARRLAHPQ
jgi:hypothetical protein